MASIGVGAKLEHEQGSGWAVVYKCKSVNFPNFTITSVDTTHLAIADYAKTYMPGMIDGDTISFESEFTSASYVTLTGLLRDVIGWRVSAPAGEGDVVTCDGFLTSLTSSMTPDDEMMISGQIKMTGLPVIS